MKVTVTGCSPDKNGLRLGLTIEHEKAGWIRFAGTVLVVDRLTLHERESLMSALDHCAGDIDESLDYPLFS